MSAGQSTKQLVLALDHPPHYGADAFLRSACNAAALDMIERWRDWQAPGLVLLGPTGSGKTHLAHMWAEAAGARLLDGPELGQRSAVDLLDGSGLAIDNADRATLAEAEFFHLFNLARETGRPLLLTARGWPRSWPFALADLQSRLQALPVAELHEPDDALLRAALVKLFADRQLMPDPTVIAFLAVRIERSLAAARAVVAAIDRTALAEGRRITRPIAARVLEAEPDDETAGNELS